MDDLDPADNHHCHWQQLSSKLEHRVEPHQHPCLLHVQIIILPVVGKEFLDFKFLPCKSFYRAHPCQIFFRNGSKLRIFLADGLVNFIQPPFHENGDRPHQDHYPQRQERQFPVQAKHAVQYHGNMDGYFNNQHPHIPQ